MCGVYVDIEVLFLFRVVCWIVGLVGWVVLCWDYLIDLCYYGDFGVDCVECGVDIGWIFF